MKRYPFLAGAVIGLAIAAPANAQASASPPPAATSQAGARDSLRVEISPELQRSLDEMAATLDRLARRIANDPELRASAVRTAQTFVSVAQLMVVQQADLLQETLRTAAERLGELAPAPASPQPQRH